MKENVYPTNSFTVVFTSYKFLLTNKTIICLLFFCFFPLSFCSVSLASDYNGSGKYNRDLST